MADADLRELERRVRTTGDLEAVRALGRARARAGLRTKPPTQTMSKLKKPVREALASAKAAIDAKDPTALAKHVPDLIEHSVLDYPSAVAGTGPLLMHALEKGHVVAARVLIEAGADITARDTRKRTPLMRSTGDEDLFALLLERGADVLARDTFQGTALHFAAGGASPRVIATLIDRGLDVNAQENGGRSPLHRAAEGLHVEAVRLLLERGADPRLEYGGERLTPLELLCAKFAEGIPAERRARAETVLAALSAVSPPPRMRGTRPEPDVTYRPIDRA